MKKEDIESSLMTGQKGNREQCFVSLGHSVICDGNQRRILLTTSKDQILEVFLKKHITVFTKKIAFRGDHDLKWNRSF